MFRSLALLSFITFFAFSVAFAQNDSAKPNEIRATPEILALFEESLQSLAQVDPNPRAGSLFQLLGFAIHLDDKAPAKKIVESLAAIAPAIEEEVLRNQLYDGIANAFCDLQEYAGAVAILQRIAKPEDRYKSQLNLAVKLVLGHEQDKTLKPFDASELLNQVALGANQAEPKDSHAVALAYSLLGRELARLEKPAESAVAFAEAINIAKAATDIREKMQIVQLVLQSQVLYSQLEAAQTTIQTLEDPEIRRAMNGAFVQALIQNEKFDEAEKLIKALPAEGAGRELFVPRWVGANIEKITDAKVGEFAALLTDESRESFLQSVVAHLLKINRSDVAVQVTKRLKDTVGAERALFAGKMELLLEEKKFAEALQEIAASKEEEGIKQYLKQQVLKMQFDETRDEDVLTKIMETFTGENKIALEEMRTEAAKAGEIADLDERMNLLFGILQDQLSITDIIGARQTVKVLTEQLAKETDPAQSIDYRLLLGRFQIAIQDKAGAKENIGKLLQMLAAVKDLKELKDLVPQPEPALGSGEGERVVVALPGAADESAIRNHLFQVYVMSANILAEADAPAESKSALEKAKTLTAQETNATQKVEKLLMLAQFLAEGN